MIDNFLRRIVSTFPCVPPSPPILEFNKSTTAFALNTRSIEDFSPSPQRWHRFSSVNKSGSFHNAYGENGHVQSRNGHASALKSVSLHKTFLFSRVSTKFPDHGSLAHLLSADFSQVSCFLWYRKSFNTLVP